MATLYKNQGWPARRNSIWIGCIEPAGGAARRASADRSVPGNRRCAESGCPAVVTGGGSPDKRRFQIRLGMPAASPGFGPGARGRASRSVGFPSGSGGSGRAKRNSVEPGRTGFPRGLVGRQNAYWKMPGRGIRPARAWRIAGGYSPGARRRGFRHRAWRRIAQAHRRESASRPFRKSRTHSFHPASLARERFDWPNCFSNASKRTRRRSTSNRSPASSPGTFRPRIRSWFPCWNRPISI